MTFGKRSVIEFIGVGPMNTWDKDFINTIWFLKITFHKYYTHYRSGCSVATGINEGTVSSQAFWRTDTATQQCVATRPGDI